MTEPKREVWVIEYKGVPQSGRTEKYYAEELAIESFGDGDPNTAVVRYVPESAWVPVTERLPEDEAIVLVFGRYEGTNTQWDWQAVCRFEGDTGLWCGIPSDCASDEATHWMPLPSPPAREEG